MSPKMAKRQEGGTNAPRRSAQRSLLLLTEACKEAPLAWTKKNLEKEWYYHVDADEKWFYVISGGGRLKIPADAPERPKTLLKSKRFVAKSMVFTARTRPWGNFNDGILRSWRVASKPFIYRLRAATFQGNAYTNLATPAKKLRDVLQKVRHNVEEECLLGHIRNR